MSTLTPEARRQKALDVACRYLDRRERTVAEVQRYLESKRVEPDAIAGAIEELRACGQLDDSRYARRFAEDKRALEHWGSERIERRLTALGVEPELIAAALSDGAPGELETAVALLRRRFPTVPADERQRARALGLLLRKGYELELAHDAIRAQAHAGAH